MRWHLKKKKNAQRVRKKQIEEKSKYLNKLIDGQEFEEAAIVRDEIKALKSESEVSHDE